MRKVLIVGIGAGDPDYLTVQAIDALRRAEVFFIPDKGAEKAALRRLREAILQRFVPAGGYRSVEFAVPARELPPHGDPGYRARVAEWRDRVEAAYDRLLAAELGDGGCGAFLVWGDPALYDGTIRIVEAIRARGVDLEVEVIPGISAVQALAARHRVPLNRIGGPVLIAPGRRIAGGMPADLDDVVVMLDGGAAFAGLEEPGLEILWGAYVGTPDEVLVAGPLSEVKDEIRRLRAALRERHGWIMDSYLLRRPAGDGE